MCQLPLISMWVSSVRPPEKRISSHLPADSMRSTVRPAIGLSTSTRSSFGRTVSKRVTTCPPIARCSVAAMRKIVSPSGIRGLDFDRLGEAPHLKSHRADHESRLFQETGEEMVACCGVVDLADQEARALTLP